MRDGLVVADRPASTLSRGGLVALMGHVAGELHRSGLIALPSDEVQVLRDELGLRDGADKLRSFLGAGRAWG